MNKFWNWGEHRIRNQMGEEVSERILTLEGTIASDSWFDDDVTPQMFKEDLNAGKGNVTVWINSPGGDVFAAAQIYNMLVEYAGTVTVKIDGIAASAASVIAMAGDRVLMSPVSMLMIHNPATVAFGDHQEMEKTIDMLNEVKDAIINAYVEKTGMSRAKLSRLMDAETWMNANKAVELGFADEIMTRAKVDQDQDEDDEDEDIELPELDDPDEDDEDRKEKAPAKSMLYSQRQMNATLRNKIIQRLPEQMEDVADQEDDSCRAEQGTGRSVAEIMDRLNIIKQFI